MKVQDRTISLNAAKIGLTNSEKTKDIKVSDMRSVFKVLDELPPVTTQPCEDAISREKVLLIIDSFKDNYGSFNFGSLIDLAREVRRLTPVIPQQQWIPVSERLPEKNMRCLVAIGRYNFTQIAMYSDLMGIIDHQIFYQGYVGHDSFKNITQHVKAWMPLPKPYELQEEER